MDFSTKEQIIERLITFVSSPGTCLFAGAGVSMRAGLPSWMEYLEFLAGVAEKYEQETSALMRKRIAAGHLLLAASLYKGCIEIPDGIKYEMLAKPFIDSYDAQKLRALMAMPFSSVVTTNYDKALHDAYYSLFEMQDESGLKLSAPKYVEFDDLSLRQAIYWKDFYIARIHGRAEIPETIILDSDDYKKTEKNPYYQEFLLHILKRYRCLWLGFSFLDPAINRIFQVIEELLPKPYPKLHLALIPSDADPMLKAKLAKLNIEVLVYNAGNNHDDLWRAIREGQRGIRSLPREAPKKNESIPGLTRFVASCYSRLKLGRKVEPLYEVVVEGIVAQAIKEAGTDGVKKEELINKVKNFISVSDADVEIILSRAIEGLSDKNICKISDSLYICESSEDNIFNEDLGKIVTAVANRMKVREGIDADEKLKSVISDIIGEVFSVRGWDLGAHLAGGNPSSSFDAWDQIESIIQSYSNRLDSTKSKPLSHSIFDFLRHPDDTEAVLLCDIGRISFGLELILNQSKSTLKTQFLPETIYLDSNVLMPAIVTGHPFNPIYSDAVVRMQSAAMGVGKTVGIFVAEEFLNEIVSHRNLAIQEVKEQQLDDREKLRRHVLFRGATNINVYIGAYASLVGRYGETSLTFTNFLGEYAPYNSERELSEFLNRKGIKVTKLVFPSEEEKALFNKVKAALESAYEKDIWGNPKPRILIAHEAGQIARLIIDTELDKKPFFVTADKRLMGFCKGQVLDKASNSIVSHLGFIQLIDLVLGIKTDERGLARLIWDIGKAGESVQIREYLIDLALRHYDEAKAMAMWQVVDEISKRAADEAAAEKLDLFSKSKEGLTRVAAFLDRFEQDFFDKMAEAIREKEKKG